MRRHVASIGYLSLKMKGIGVVSTLKALSEEDDPEPPSIVVFEKIANHLNYVSDDKLHQFQRFTETEINDAMVSLSHLLKSQHSKMQESANRMFHLLNFLIHEPHNKEKFDLFFAYAQVFFEYHFKKDAYAKAQSEFLTIITTPCPKMATFINESHGDFRGFAKPYYT